jgi:mannose-6-phosphate isomerase-like protein (cupin superfamily)
MKRTMSIGAALLLSATFAAQAAGQAGATARGTQAPPPAAPAPGSAGIFRAGADLQAALDRAKADGGELAGASITATDQYRGSMVHRTAPNGAIAHPGNTELHYIVEGSGTVETGGTIMRREGAPAIIEGGESHRVVKGDIIIIPAGSAHRYSQIDEPITYLEWRFVAPE